MSLWNKTFGPMLLKEIDKPFNSNDYLYEIKFDGIRALIFVSESTFKIMSRNKIDITYLYPELKEIQKNIKNKIILDGEIVCFNNNKPSFSKLQERSHIKDKNKIKEMCLNNPVTYVGFDILYYDEDLTNLSLIDRKEKLNTLKENDYFFISKVYKKGIDLFNKIKKLDLEGIIAKKKDSVYQINTRSFDWIKIKNLKVEDFIVGGYEIKKGDYISLLLGELKNKKLYFVGKASLTKSNSLYNKVVNSKEISSPFVDYNKRAIYIKPNLKVKIKYLERTKENHLRQPVIKKEKI